MASSAKSRKRYDSALVRNAAVGAVDLDFEAILLGSLQNVAPIWDARYRRRNQVACSYRYPWVIPVYPQEGVTEGSSASLPEVDHYGLRNILLAIPKGKRSALSFRNT